MKPNIEKLRKKYMDNPPEGMSSRDIRRMSEEELQFNSAPKGGLSYKVKKPNHLLNRWFGFDLIPVAL